MEQLPASNFQVGEQISLHQGVAVCQQGHWSHCEETRLVKKLPSFSQDKVALVFNRRRGFDIT